MELVLGRIPVLECLRAGKRKARRLFLLHSAKGMEELEEAAGAVEVIYCPRQDLNHKSNGQNHQGVILEAEPIPCLDLPDWLERHDADNQLLVILDSIEDPQNFGAIVRTATACGASGVLFAERRAAPLSSAALKAATGAMEYMDLVRVTNLARAMKQLKEGGFWIGGLDMHGDSTLWDANLTGKIALVVGSEGKGMRRLIQEGCDFTMNIPIDGPITSLNASVSTAIALAEWMRQTR